MVESLLLHRYPFGSQLYIVFNTFNLVRVPRRLPGPCHSHRSRTAQRHQVPRPSSQPSLSCIVSHFTLDLTRDVRTQTVPLCSVSTTHPTATADASTQLSRSSCSCVLRHTVVGVRSHFNCVNTSGKSHLRTPPRTSLLPSSSSGASFPKPSRRVPSPAPPYFRMHLLRLHHTVPLSQMRPPSSRSQNSFLGASTPMTHWIASLLSFRKRTLPLHHPKHMDATLSISSTSGGHARTPVPRAQLNGTPPPATRSRGSSSLRFSPWYPCQSSARATPFATCCCFYLARCVIHIPHQRRPCSHMLVPPKWEHTPLVHQLPTKGVQVPPWREPSCDRYRPTCWAWLSRSFGL